MCQPGPRPAGRTPAPRGAYREQRVDPQGARDDRPVGHVQPAVDLARSLAGEHLAPVVHHAGLGRRPHRVAAERVDADQLVLQQLRPYRVLQVGPSSAAVAFRTTSSIRPNTACSPTPGHRMRSRSSSSTRRPPAVVVGHDQVSQRMAKSPVVGPQARLSTSRAARSRRFPDGLEAVVNAGATAVIQPGGSVKDQDVIDAADRLGLAMVFTGIRHFRH